MPLEGFEPSTTASKAVMLSITPQGRCCKEARFHFNLKIEKNQFLR